MNGVALLKSQYPWPASEPDVPTDPRGWYAGENRKLLASILTPNTEVVLELGSFLGLSTRHLCEAAPNATIIGIDHWKGSAEHLHRPDFAETLPVLYETFLKNLWAWRDRVIPIRELTLAGMEAVAQAGVVPKVVYIDAAHDADSVAADLTKVLDLWPAAHIVGDDWMWTSVREGVGRVLPSIPPTRTFCSHRACWEIAP